MARDLTIVKNGADLAFYVDGTLQGAHWPEPRLEVLTKLLGVEIVDLTAQGLTGQGSEPGRTGPIDFIREAPTLELLKERMKFLRKQKRERRIAHLEQELRDLRSQEEPEEPEGPVRESDK